MGFLVGENWEQGEFGWNWNAVGGTLGEFCFKFTLDVVTTVIHSVCCFRKTEVSNVLKPGCFAEALASAKPIHTRQMHAWGFAAWG